MEENEVAGKKKSNIKRVVILALIALLAGAGIRGWLVSRGGQKSSVPAADQKGKTVSDSAAAMIYGLETFVVNLNDPGGKRYLKAKIDLEYTDIKLLEELKQRLPQLRDAILLLLSNKSTEDVQGVEGKIALRTELIMKINQIMKTGRVRNLYFTQFVIQ